MSKCLSVTLKSRWPIRDCDFFALAAKNHMAIVTDSVNLLNNYLELW